MKGSVCCAGGQAIRQTLCQPIVKLEYPTHRSLKAAGINAVSLPLLGEKPTGWTLG